jgi:hypothetical protein
MCTKLAPSTTLVMVLLSESLFCFQSCLKMTMMDGQLVQNLRFCEVFRLSARLQNSERCCRFISV